MKVGQAFYWVYVVNKGTCSHNPPPPPPPHIPHMEQGYELERNIVLDFHCYNKQYIAVVVHVLIHVL